jgi:hypothetical protein
MMSAAIRPYMTRIGSTSVGWAPGNDPPSSIWRSELRYCDTESDRSSNASTPLSGRSWKGFEYATLARATVPSDENNAALSNGPTTDATPSSLSRSAMLDLSVDWSELSDVMSVPLRLLYTTVALVPAAAGKSCSRRSSASCEDDPGSVKSLFTSPPSEMPTTHTPARSRTHAAKTRQ